MWGSLLRDRYLLYGQHNVLWGTNEIKAVSRAAENIKVKRNYKRQSKKRKSI